MARNKRKTPHKSSGGKWSKSVADLLQDQGKFVANENLSVNHPKIKTPNVFKK